MKRKRKGLSVQTESPLPPGHNAVFFQITSVKRFADLIRPYFFSNELG
jgi:hypothetical protein